MAHFVLYILLKHSYLEKERDGGEIILQIYNKNIVLMGEGGMEGGMDQICVIKGHPNFRVGNSLEEE